MNNLVAVVFAAVIAVSLAATNECHLKDCGDTYAASTKEDCVAVAEWRTCVWSQTPEQDGLCNAVGITAAKTAVKAAELFKGCDNGANGINVSVFSCLLVAVIALFFRS